MLTKQVPFIYDHRTTLLDVPNRISLDEQTYRLLDEWNLPIYLFPSRIFLEKEFLNDELF